MTMVSEQFLPDGFRRGDYYDQREDPYTMEMRSAQTNGGWAQLLVYDHPNKPHTVVAHDSEGTLVVFNNRVSLEVEDGGR